MFTTINVIASLIYNWASKRFQGHVFQALITDLPKNRICHENPVSVRRLNIV